MDAEEGQAPPVMASPMRVSTGELVRNGDPNIPLNRSQGATILMLIAAGLGGLFVLAAFIFNILAVSFVFRPIALFIEIFWIFQFVEVGISFSSATAAGYGKIVQRVVMWDILGMFLSVLGLLSIWAGFGVTVMFYWRCLTGTGSLTESEELMCNDEWILGIVWWGGLILLSLLPILTFVAHIYSFATTQIPNVFGIFNTGSFMISGKIPHRGNVSTSRNKGKKHQGSML